MNASLKDRKIILGVTGSIAAYKACSLLRLMVKAGADVQVVMTEAACHLVGPDTFKALSGHDVPVDIFNDSDKISHIALTRGADLTVIAPASANTIAKMAGGFADNMLTAAVLAGTCPVIVAPAMNVNMYRNAATQENIDTLVRRGIYVMKPETGDLACGVSADGRMPEPEHIMEFICSILNGGHERLGFTPRDALPSPKEPLELERTRLLPKASGAGVRVMITAGPTVEALDPVRFISNRSSGKMGFALAEAMKRRGAEVTLVAGPVNLATPAGVTRVDVKSALDMLQAVESRVQDTDVFIGCAAVADYRAAHIAEQKIKKTSQNEDGLTISLVRNPDIVATVGKLEHGRPFTVGFAAETEHGEENARSKLERKHLDLIALNYVQSTTQGFESDLNELRVFDADGELAHLPLENKQMLAGQLADIILERAKKGEH